MCLRNLFGGKDCGCTWMLFIIILLLICDDGCGEERGCGC